MKYAFIDYENLNTLDGLNLCEYERIFLFIGSSENQSAIHLTEKFNDELNITLIKVKDVSKNNVDFHISYYLGKLDVSADKNIAFHILSNDQGYDGICHFIQHQKEGRTCCRKEVKTGKIKPEWVKIENNELTQAIEQYTAHIKSTPTRHLPVKLKSLYNDISSRTVIRNLDNNKAANVDSLIQSLVQKRILKIVENNVVYLIKQ